MNEYILNSLPQVQIFQLNKKAEPSLNPAFYVLNLLNERILFPLGANVWASKVQVEETDLEFSLVS